MRIYRGFGTVDFTRINYFFSGKKRKREDRKYRCSDKDAFKFIVNFLILSLKNNK